MQPYGVASLNFMNYTDDVAMHMFTHDQAAVMAFQVSDSGESYSLTQHPELLLWSSRTAVKEVRPAIASLYFRTPLVALSTSHSTIVQMC